MPRRPLLCSFTLRAVFIATGLGLFGPRPQARADSSDVSLLFVTKTQLYSQDSPGNPTLRANPFAFEAGAVATPLRPNGITSGQVTPPGGTAKVLTNLGGGSFFFDGGTFAKKAALTAAYPDTGSPLYAFVLQTVTSPPQVNDSVAITGDLYPTNVPKLLSGTWSSGALQVDATAGYPFMWNDVAPFVS